MQAKSRAASSDRLSDEEVTAQLKYEHSLSCIALLLLVSGSGVLDTLISAATDTTSGAMARVFELLTLHPDVQLKLREELISADVGNSLQYDALVSPVLLDAVCQETLRL